MSVWRFFSRDAMNRNGTVKFAARFSGNCRCSSILSKICLAM